MLLIYRKGVKDDLMRAIAADPDHVLKALVDGRTRQNAAKNAVKAQTARAKTSTPAASAGQSPQVSKRLRQQRARRAPAAGE